MKKNNNKGFILVETIVVSVVVMTSLVLLYNQFTTLANSFYKSFKYNNVNNLYLTKHIRDYINKDQKKELKEDFLKNQFLKLSCNNKYFNDDNYCKTIVNVADAKEILILPYNLTEFKRNINNYNLKETTKRFIKSLNTNEINGTRIIIEYENDNFVTLRFS